MDRYKTVWGHNVSSFTENLNEAAGKGYRVAHFGPYGDYLAAVMEYDALSTEARLKDRDTQRTAKPAPPDGIGVAEHPLTGQRYAVLRANGRIVRAAIANTRIDGARTDDEQVSADLNANENADTDGPWLQEQLDRYEGGYKS